MSEGDKKVSYYSPGGVDGSIIFEQALGPHGENGFAVYNPMWNEVKFDVEVESEDEEKIYKPLAQTLWCLAKFPNENYRLPAYVDASMVFDEVKSYIYEFVEFPHEALYDVASLWVMASYLPEKWQSIPYLIFIGPKDSGKTRALEVLWQLSYRAILSPSFSSAALFRCIEKYSPTLLLDEAEIYSSEQRSEAIAVLNAGYRRGQYVLRVDREGGGLDFFRCFGFKALASTNIFIPTLESRGILINMRRNVRDVPLFLNEEKAANLRLMLLIYRFVNLQSKETEKLTNGDVLKYLPIRHGRIAELFFPLISVCPNENVRLGVGKFASEVYAKRVEEEKASVEAEIVEVLLNLKDKVEAGKLSIRDITSKFNEGRLEKQQWNERSIGRWLKRLGFTKTRISGGHMAIFYDLNLVSYLAKRYGYLEKTSLTSLTSPAMECFLKHESEVSEKSEVSTASLDDLTSVYWKDEPLTEKECGVCGYVKPTVWEAVTTKGQVIAICEDCVRAYQTRRDNVEG